MSANNRDQYQGLLIPDARLCQVDALWDAESSYGQQSPHPGRPAPARDTEALLLSSGTMDAGQSVDVLTVDGGPVGRSARAAGIVWKNSTDGANSYRGREIPITLTGWEAVEWVTGNGYTHTDCVTLQAAAYRDQVVIVASEPSSGDVVAWRRSKDGTVQSAVTIHDATTEGKGFTPCLVEVGDRLFCLHWARGNGAAAQNLFIRTQVSIDGGATWTIARRQASELLGVRASITFGGVAQDKYQPRSLSAAHKDGQVVVLAHLWQQVTSGGSDRADTLAQWASPNLATKLDRVDLLDATAGVQDVGRCRVIAHAGQFLAVLVDNTANGFVRSVRFASAYDNVLEQFEATQIDNASANATSPVRQTDADLALVADDVGLLWLLVRIADAGVNDRQRVELYFSQDDGLTFETVSTDDQLANLAGSVWGIGRTGGGVSHEDAYLTQFAATWQRGRLLLSHTWVAATGSNDESVGLLYLGGYSDLTVAPWSAYAGLQNRVPWVYTLLPIERAQDLTMYTASATGTTSNTLEPGFERLRSGDGLSAGRFAVDATDSKTGDVLLCAQFAARGSGIGASSITDTTAFLFRVDDGARGVEVGLYLQTTELGIYDRVSGAQLARFTGLPNKIRQYRVAVFADEAASVFTCQVWYRTWDREADRTWTSAGTFALTDDGGTVGANRVAFGAFSSSTAGAEIDLYEGPHWSTGDLQTANCLTGSDHHWHTWTTSSNPDGLGLTPLSTRPVYLSKGLQVRAIDGPALRDDSWVVKTAYQFPVERLWPSYARSPRVRWRSVDDTTQQSIAVSLDRTLLGTDESHPGAPLYALWLDGINWRTGELQGYAGGAWSKIADIDASAGFGSLSYTREGASILPNSDTTKQIAGQELVGWDWRPFTGGVVRRIKANRGGRWATGATAGPRVRVAVDGIDATDPTSGSCYLSARQVCVVFELGATDVVSGFRLVIDAQDTVEGHLEVGTMQLGPVWVSGQVPDWGRRIQQQLGTAYTVRQDGSVTASQPAPTGYGVEVGWAAGVDTRQFHDCTAEPTYITTTASAGVEGVATWAATVYDLQGEIDALGSQPLVYLPKIERGAASDVRNLTRWFEVYPARAPNGLSITSAYGNEGTDETLTVASVTLEPEL